MRQFHLTNDGLPALAGDQDPSAILLGLNDVQRKAVTRTEGPVLIIAGPGSGKTRTLTHRIAYLIASGRARPYDILALTFTNKAAREMKSRIQKLVGEEPSKGIWMGTFHAIFARLLRREAERLGYTSDYSIYDTDDTERVLRQLMDRYNIDSKQYHPRSIRSLISSAKNQMISAQEYARLASTPHQEKAATIFGPYQETLKRSNALDFDDLLLKPIELFQHSPDTLEAYQTRWKYVHIDEYQDTNRAQYLLANMLSSRHKNLCVVGDDAQSIYAFRGADIGNILSFQRDYPESTTIRLEQNYRSTKRILRLADSIIKKNEDQLEKTLWTENREGDFVLLMEALSEKDEAQKIERSVRDLRMRSGYRYSDFAVLYRTNAQSRSLEDAFRRSNVPYRVYGGVSFYQRKEIKDVLAYLRLVINPNDTASLRRVINYPTRGIGAKTIERISEFAQDEGFSLWQAIENVDKVGLPARALNAVSCFHAMIKKYADQADNRPAEELAREIIRETNILNDLRKDDTPENLMRWENVQELFNAIAEFADNYQSNSLSAFLQEVSLYTDFDEEDDNAETVTLMTLHASKGLEYPAVYVSGLEEGLFPLAQASQDRKELEEERRLFYVGVTRAQEYLFLSHAHTRFRYGQHESSVRSRFLEEIDAEVVRTESGSKHESRNDRFTLSKNISYSDLDPHYYRRDLGGGGKVKQKKEKETSYVGIENKERRFVYDEGEGEIVPGVHVEHNQFGEGKVISMEGRGEQAKAVVFFKEVGQKKLVLKFARLRLLSR